MPVCVMGAGPSGPAHLTTISISQVSSGSNHTNLSVKGRVVHKGPLVPSDSHKFLLKAIIRDDADSNLTPQDVSINVVLFGTLAKDFSQTVSQGDVVAASGFTVGKSPTASTDRLHPCNLLLSGEHAFIHVYQAPPTDRASQGADKRKGPSLPAKVSKVPKYTYTKLDDLKPGEVVNVYGVVVFFKPPFKSRGSDFCSSLKITDQSQRKIGCTIFCDKPESHPQIFQIGDIIRMHRVKPHVYYDTLTLLNTFGFSALAFDGAVGAAMEPRTASRSFHFTADDRRVVRELRSWAAGEASLPSSDTTITLSAVQPKMYFDFTCQLLSKATVDTTCMLLRVWDGTRCSHSLLKVKADPDIVEGPASFSKEQEKLIASVLVFDNHAQFAKQIKPGDFLRIYNLRAIPGSVQVPGLSSSQPEEVNHLSFHLHGGTAYGKGIRVLPDDCPDVRQLKRATEAFQDEVDQHTLSDSLLWDVWDSPRPGGVCGASPQCLTGRTCDHILRPLTLRELKRAVPGGVHHVRVQLRSYEPRGLHQALKLYCSKCSTMQDVPDDQHLAGLFEASANCGPYTPPPWTLSGEVHVPGELLRGPPDRIVNVHMSAQLVSKGKTKELMFLTGCSLKEACDLAADYHNVVPLTSSGGVLALLHPTAPFLFRGRKRFYRCQRCSQSSVREPPADGLLDQKTLAEVFNVQLLDFVLLMKFQLQDPTDTLDVFLWTHAESFFKVSAEDAAVNQEAQDSIRQTVERLCPPGDITGMYHTPINTLEHLSHTWTHITHLNTCHTPGHMSHTWTHITHLNTYHTPEHISHT
nr:protection of telomeres protein 1-like isoform X2 [Nerophis lumbriciformis]